jgi:hypothetical protein
MARGERSNALTILESRLEEPFICPENLQIIRTMNGFLSLWPQASVVRQCGGEMRYAQPKNKSWAAIR